MRVKFNNFKLNNNGLSLVELIITISIMSILVGTASLGFGIVFSRDAQKCANTINDAVYETRMANMSKTNKYTLVLGIDSNGDYYYTIDDNDSSTTNDKSEVISDNGKIETITCDVDGVDYTISAAQPVRISFDKAKGNVTKINSDVFGTGTGTISDGIITFNITAKRTDRTSAVKIVTATGKHTVGDF